MTRTEERTEVARILDAIRREGKDGPTYRAILMQALQAPKTIEESAILSEIQAWESLSDTQREEIRGEMDADFRKAVRDMERKAH
jgi:hypothetical protein